MVGLLACMSLAPLTPNASAAIAQGGTLPAAYQGVQWTALSYPGEDCSFPGPGNETLSDPLVTDGMASVTVHGVAEPLAVVSVSCQLNHVYANLYVFKAPPAGSRTPTLVQTLGDYQGTEQLASLTTSRDRIRALMAGYAKGKQFKGLCCPNVVSVRRWVWRSTRFVALAVQKVTRIVMPDVVGLSEDKASDRLVALGILFSDEEGNPEGSHDIIEKQSPPPGTVLRPPDYQVSLTAR